MPFTRWARPSTRPSGLVSRSPLLPLALATALTVWPVTTSSAQPHPSIFLTKQEAAAIRAGAPKYPLLQRSLNEAKQTLAAALAAPIDVPQPGEAGGYEHERHKQNYREMQLAGQLFQITGDVRYARFVRDMLDKYAVLY